jgi:hypothetical protein
MAGALGRAAGREAVSGFMDLATRQASNKARKTAKRKASKARRKANVEEWAGENPSYRGSSETKATFAKDLGDFPVEPGKFYGMFSSNRKPYKTYDNVSYKNRSEVINNSSETRANILRPTRKRAATIGRARAFSKEDVNYLNRISGDLPIDDGHIRAYSAAKNILPEERLGDFAEAYSGLAPSWQGSPIELVQTIIFGLM